MPGMFALSQLATYVEVRYEDRTQRLFQNDRIEVFTLGSTIYSVTTTLKILFDNAAGREFF